MFSIGLSENIDPVHEVFVRKSLINSETSAMGSFLSMAYSLSALTFVVIESFEKENHWK
jgi:hypothetical protein